MTRLNEHNSSLSPVKPWNRTLLDLQLFAMAEWSEAGFCGILRAFLLIGQNGKESSPALRVLLAWFAPETNKLSARRFKWWLQVESPTQMAETRLVNSASSALRKSGHQAEGISSAQAPRSPDRPTAASHTLNTLLLYSIAAKSEGK
jgi:hypothetical protein